MSVFYVITNPDTIFPDTNGFEQYHNEAFFKNNYQTHNPAYYKYAEERHELVVRDAPVAVGVGRAEDVPALPLDAELAEHVALRVREHAAERHLELAEVDVVDVFVGKSQTVSQ